HAADDKQKKPQSQTPNAKQTPNPHSTLDTRHPTLKRMDTTTAIAQIRQACKSIGAELMRIHPAVPALGNEEVQGELYKTLFEITKEVEVIKKRLAKLESGSDTPEL